MKGIIFCLMLLVSFSVFSQTERKIIFTDKAPAPIGSYSQAIKVGNTLYLSGQVALKPDGTMDSTSIENEATQVLANLKVILAAAKMEFKNVVKSTIYLTSLKDFKKVNDIYAKHFPENPPARETIEVKNLPKGAHIEISMVAVN